MSNRHAICLVVDGLRAAALGTYGNTTYPTPQLDALASRALVSDWLWADSPHLADFYRSAWQSVHALRPAFASERPSVLEQLQAAGVRQWVVTDDPWLTEQSGQLPFDEALLFENGAESAADRLEDTALGRFFAEAIEQLHQWREDVAGADSLMWLHSQGLFGPWDAPLELRADLLDDEDPPPAEFVQPPDALREVDDPDVLLSYRVAYAAQIAVLDACVGAFVQAVEAEFAESETLIMLTSSRGFALGEHGSIGTDCEELFSERLHLPWLLYPCGNSTPLPRRAALDQPADIGATLTEWLGAEAFAPPADGISISPSEPERDGQARQLAATTNHNDEIVLRTPAWMLRVSPSEPAEDAQPELFTKPDDRWETNDVAGLCPEIVEQLTTEIADFQQCCQQEKSLPIVPQDEELVTPSR